ncbi:MAG: flagellar hook-basal body complex protein FliE [Desulfovibrionaceae bacterium]
MAVNNIALQAYQRAAQFKNQFNEAKTEKASGHQDQARSFTSTIKDSLKNVNESKLEAKSMIESFASGKTQNVHELMITMQKASVAMSMTGAVRSKVMQAYKEIMNMPV